MENKEVLKIAGLKLTIDGAAEFQNSLRNINAQMRLSSAELKKVTAEYGKNSTAAQALAAKKKDLETRMQSQREITKRLNDVLKETEQRYGENSVEAQTMRTKVLESEAAEKRLETQLKKVSVELAKQTSGAFQLGQKLEAAGKKMKAFSEKASMAGGAMTKYITVPILAAGAGLFKLGENFDDALDQIRIDTGATGETLNTLQKDFEAVYSNVPSGIDNVSTAIAGLNTRLGLTGKPLQSMATQMLNLARLTKTDVSTVIQSATRMFQDAGIAQEDYADALDYTFRVSQQTGIGIDRLQQLMTQFGGPLRQMGFDWQESAAMLGKFEKEGVNTELVVGSLRIALGKMAKEGIKDPPKALAEITKRIKEAGTAGEANAIAIEAFGAKAGPDMAAAIREGRLDFDALLNSLKNGKETINGAAKATDGFAEKFQTLKNKLSLALKPLADGLLGALEDLIPSIVDAAKGVGDLIKEFNKLSPETKKIILMAIGLSAALGPVVKVVGTLSSGIGSLVGGFGKLVSKFVASKAAAAAAEAGVEGVASAAAGSAGALGGLGGILSKIATPTTGLFALAIGGALALAAAIEGTRVTTYKFGEDWNAAMDKFNAAVEASSGVMEVFISDTTETGRTVEEVRGKIDETEAKIVDAYKQYMADKGVARDKDLAEIAKYNKELNKLLLEEWSVYSTSQQIFLNELRLGTQKVSQENIADVVKSINENKEQAQKGADEIYAINAAAVENNTSLTRKQKDDQLRLLAETREESRRIAQQRAADSAYYAQQQLLTNDKSLAGQLQAIRKMGAESAQSEKNYADTILSIKEKYKNDSLGLTQALQTAERQHAEDRRANAKKIADAWISMDAESKAAWLSLINTQIRGGRTLDANTRQTVSALISIFATTPGALSGIGRDAMIALGRAILSTKGPKTAAKATDDECINAFKSSVAEYAKAGRSAAEAVGKGIKDKKQQVKTAATNIKITAIDGLDGLSSAFTTAGLNAIQGLINAFKNSKNAIARAVGNVGQLMLDTFNRKLDSHSPSRETEKIGKYAGQGLVLGMLAEEKRVRDAAIKLASASMPPIEDAGGVGTGAPARQQLTTQTTESYDMQAKIIAAAVEKAMSSYTIQFERRVLGRVVKEVIA